MPPLPLSSPSFSFSSFLPRPLLLLHLSKISRNMASRSNTKPRKKGPIRVIIRISSSGQRLTVPPDGLTLNSTLADVVSRVSLPSVSSNATMVCLRQVAPYNEWSGTTLKSMLDGDDGCAGILLTFDVTASKSAIDKTAASLNIKPEPMDISEDTTQQNAVQRHPSNAMSPAEAWSIVLSSNFDTASKSCLLTLLKIIDNILSRSDPKVRCIRYGNPNFQSKVASCRGALEFLYSLGFVPTYAVFGNMSEPESLELKNESRQVLLRGREVLILSAKKDFGIEDDDLPKLPMAPVVSTSAALTAPTAAAAANSSRTQEFNIYKGHSTNIAAQQAGAPDPYADKSLSTTERTLQNLEAKKRNMEKQLQSSVEMDRCLNAYLPGDGPITGSSAVAQESRGDSSLLAARMKRMEEERRKREEGGFTTKAMRDLEKMKKAKVYSHAQIRINFPDGSHLHARFLPTETISTVYNVVRSSFNTNFHTDFELYVAPPRRLLTDTKTLEDEELVPAAKIHVSWKSNLGDLAIGGFLRKEVFKVNTHSNNVSMFPESKPIMLDKKAPPSNAGSTVGNDDGQSKEEQLMARMMGKGLLSGKKKSSGNGGENGDKKGKPKWFK